MHQGHQGLLFPPAFPSWPGSFLGRTHTFLFLQLAGIFPHLLAIGFKAFSGAPGNAVGGGEGACSSSEITHGTTLLLWHQSKDAWVWGRGGYSHRRRAVRSLLCVDNTRAVFKRVSSSKSPLMKILSVPQRTSDVGSSGASPEIQGFLRRPLNMQRQCRAPVVISIPR